MPQAVARIATTPDPQKKKMKFKKRCSREPRGQTWGARASRSRESQWLQVTIKYRAQEPRNKQRHQDFISQKARQLRACSTVSLDMVRRRECAEQEVPELSRMKEQPVSTQ
jgi:hypothetical protein